MCSIRNVDFANPSPIFKKWPSKDRKKLTIPLCNLESEMNQIENVTQVTGSLVLYTIN